MADRESKSGNFWGGFLFGSLIGGVVGALVANTLSRRALAEADDFAEDDEPSTDDHSNSNGRDATRRNLEQKIAQLNASIDAVSKELSIDEAQRRRRTHLRPRAEAETSPDPEGNQ